MRAAPLALCVLAACMGPADETFIGELRVVAMATDPPVVDPGSPFELTVTVADPLAEGGDLLVWSCVPDSFTQTLPTEEACVTSLRPIDSEQLTFDWIGLAPLPLWSIACAPGMCGDLSAASEADLADPFTWLQELPLSGVSAGFRSTPVRLDPTAPDPVNPKLVTEPEGPIGADPENGTAMTFVSQGATTAYGFATAGGFGSESYEVSAEGEVTLTWFAPEDGTPARLYVVFEDGNGGIDVWIGDGAAP